MNCKELFQKIDELSPKYIKVWEDVCNIESPTSYKEGVDKVCEYFVNMAKEKGWEIEVERMEVAGDVACITLNPDAKGAPVCLSGHMDTVHPLGLFGTPPVHIDEKNIYGPGVIDCKGGCVASFLAMDALEQIGFCDRPVKLILQSDEETGSKTSGKKTIEFMCEKAKGAIAFLNTEGVSDKDPYKLTIRRKGILRFRFNITGKAVHSSYCHAGANALTEAAHKIIELEKMKKADGLTCNCGVIEGGTAVNTVAEKCSFLADIRFATKEEEEQVRKLAKDLAEKSFVEGCVCELEEVSSRPAMEYSEKNEALFNNINEIFAQNGLPKRIPVFCNGGSDTAYTTQAGIPCVDSIGVFGAGIHSIRERALLSSLGESAKCMAAITLYL